MPSRISRKTLVKYATKQLLAGDESLADELAAYLIEQRHERDASLIARDIEDELLKNNIMIVSVESARALTDELRKMICQMVVKSSNNPKLEVKLRERVNSELIGGVKIATPSQTMDSTMAERLNKLKNSRKT